MPRRTVILPWFDPTPLREPITNDNPDGSMVEYEAALTHVLEHEEEHARCPQFHNENGLRRLAAWRTIRAIHGPR